MNYSICLLILLVTFSACQQQKRNTAQEERSTKSEQISVNLRKHVRINNENMAWESREFQESWDPSKTAFIITDMWDEHWCESATRRVGELAPRMNETVHAAREMGLTIIHAPSGTMDFYAEWPQRKAAKSVPYHAAPEAFPINDWCYLDPEQEAALPIDDSDGGCDQPCSGGEPCEEREAWSRQTPEIDIAATDFISDQGQEIFNIIQSRNIENIVVMGVHLNMCVLGRPFAIRQMANLDKNVVLMRDMTDTMYNPEMLPYVDHFTGTDLVVAHVEKYWAPSMLSTDFTGKPAFRFASRNVAE
ncbi:Nicotinamidase-related amidase [Cyclobacterium lianum]|uniref:Nicotinamidase-related amidase n=1 Tax=Cyclobacterium lianum TaxID=388280 RepID=A0A1M7NSH4_9BACT|nr:protein-signal peptide and transmembrane prediction [Cyclobacterium lianum]SHN06582.1 Nicotinamidase-related amidase [Cyclobacterium lianum]